MKKQILTIVVTAMISIALFGGSRTPEIVQPTVQAQSSSAKGDFITKARGIVQSYLGALENAHSLKLEKDARNFSFADGDFVGSNAGITAAVFTQALTDLEDLRNKSYAGGSVSVGVINNVYKIK